MNPHQAEARPSRIARPKKSFVAADHRPDKPDGRFRVVLVSTGSVASVKIPDIVGALSRIPEIEVQVVATKASLHFYDQAKIDAAVQRGRQHGVGGVKGMSVDGDGTSEEGIVSVWTDEDEWSDWKAIGDPILHIELRRWADLVVIAPCSADFLAKLAAGFSDNLALSMMRALTPQSPVILCPAMNTHMYQHAFTAEHLKVVQEKLGYMISGPQGAGRLACGDEGVGKMTDWREIVSMIENYGAMFIRGHAAHATTTSPDQQAQPPAESQPLAESQPPAESAACPTTPPTPGRSPSDGLHQASVWSTAALSSFRPRG